MRGALHIALVAALLGGCAAEIADGVQAGDPPDQNKGGGNGSPSPGAGGSSGGGQYTPPASGNTSPDAGASVADGSAAAFCAQLLPISAPSFQDLPAGPGFKLRVRVQPTDTTAPPVTWVWSASFGDGAGMDVPVSPLNPQATEIELPLEKPGRYQLTASASLRTVACSVGAIAFATAREQRLGQYRVRIVPAAGPFPVQETKVQAMAGVPLVRPLTVHQGQPVTFQPRDELGTHGIASYVRVSQLGSTLSVEGHTGKADFKPALLALFSYDVLFVPDDEIAPWVALGLTPAMINVLPQTLSPGAALTGRLVDGAGAPLRDGRVILRAGALTSTVGSSSAAGDFALRVRAGRFAVTVAPPPSSGLPELFLPAAEGLTIDESPAAGRVEVKWAPVTPAPVGLVVRAADGVLFAAGARLRLERVQPLPAAGSLVYTPPAGTPITRMVAGQVRVNGQVGADGTANLPSVPPGSYRLLVTPSDADRTSALTTVALEIPAGGISGRAVRLSTRVKLRGTLLPAEAAGTRVFATPQDSDPPRPVASAVVGPGGAYQLEVDPDRRYVLWADPGLGKPFARAQLAHELPTADGAQVPERTLPRALPFKGNLTGDASASVISGAVIQVFCDVASPYCLDPDIVLSEGVSDRQGAFSLTVPDPGTM